METIEAPAVADLKQPLSDALTFLEEATAKTEAAANRQGGVYSQTVATNPRTSRYQNCLTIAGIPPRYTEAHLTKNCDRYATMPGKQNALKMAQDFAANGFIVDRSANRYALYFCGDFGRGKTWLATATLKALIWNQLDALSRTDQAIWIKFHALVREIQACYNPAAQTDTLTVMQRYQTAPLLLVDDIGDIEAQGETEDRRRILYEIIDIRNDHMRPTILTSNLDPDTMEDHYGGRSFQRVLELCAFCEMKGDNLRDNPVK